MKAPRFDGTWAGFRDAARAALAAGLRPEDAVWSAEAQKQPSLFDAVPLPAAAAAPAASGSERANAAPVTSHVPVAFVRAAETVALHRDPGVWDLLYRLVYRLTHGEPHLLEDEADGDVRSFREHEAAVHRDVHKMHAFVRFRRVEDDDGERFVAWYAPDHRILRRAVPFFRGRFAVQRWSILTPDESAFWDGVELTYGPGVAKGAAPDHDDLEDLWRTYYASVFQPARVNLRKTKQEMPVRYWHSLPEAALVPELVRTAAVTTESMMRRQEPVPSPARAIATETKSLEELRAAARSCTACPLYEHATQTVFGEGPERARIMLVGEQPGDEEDVAGRPFVGPAGRLLDSLLDEAGLERKELYVTNAVKHFKFVPAPRGKRRLHQKPVYAEVMACRPWLEGEIARVRPRVVVALGATAGQSFLGTSFRLMRSLGQTFETPWAPHWIATYHPSAVLRMPDETQRAKGRAQLVHDLRRAGELAGMSR